MLRLAIRALAVLVVLIIVLVGGIFLISGERLAKIAGERITAMSGREVSLSGSLRPQLFPNLGVRTGGFEIAGTRGDAPLISGEALSVGVDLWALLSRRIDVQEVTLVGPVVTLIKDADGNANWATTDDTPAAVGDSGAGGVGQSDLSLAGLSVQNGTFRYQDVAAGTDLVFENIDVAASMAASDTPLTASLSLDAGGQTASADIEVGALSALLAGAVSAVSLDARVGQNAIAFVGDATVDGRLTGDFSASLPSPGALAALSGGEAAAVPEEFLPIEVSGSLAASAEGIDIAGGDYRFGKNRLQGPVSVALSDVPFVVAELSANALDLSFLSAEEGSATEDSKESIDQPADGTGWSTDPIDASG
ncbi:MAG: AsmA family protein, partial [Paracoccaceae bacterium]